ncbi:MAG: DEDD exonuclease domain-containing protein [Acidimicrobiia bacterium]|nr:DEDD exonuclease domain-containing protein [Acidimicrobiia bacterium]
MPLPVQRSFDDLGAPLFEVPFCVLDLETTGGSPADCEITEIGAVRFERGQETGRFQTLVNPGLAIPPYITVLTGITQAMVVEAPKIGEALPSFLEFIGDAVIVGHNVRFDLSFLNAAATRLGYGRLPNRSTDTLRLARRLCRNEVRNLKLQSLAAHFRSPVQPTHRALDDARATAHVFWQLLERAGVLGVTHLEDLMALPTARGAPNYRKIELCDALPRRPGVYLFKDRTGAIIYVGKAKNLRTRVRSYFYGDDRRTTEQLMRDLDSIDYRVCSTDLEAEITELRLIQAHIPRYNRRSKPPKSSYWVKLTDERFPRLSLVRTYRDDDCLYLGPFRSKRSAEIVMHAVWDAVPIRRCTGAGGRRTRNCQFSQLGVAACPCDGSISDADYELIVAALRVGVESAPQLMLDGISDRMRRHAEASRFEEAAWCRDRYRALARTIERRRAWTALQQAGMLWAENAEGEGVAVEAGRLTACWEAGSQVPLTASAAQTESRSQVPESVAVAEEARLIWKWLNKPSTRIVDMTGTMAMPLHPVPELAW